MFLGIVFICSMEYLVCVCAASLIRKVVSKKTKWSYEKVKKAARVIGHTRDCVHRSLAKVLFAVEGNKFWSHREFVFWLFWGEACGLVKMWPRGETRARCRSRIRHCIRHC